ncbi:MAG TPA: translation elongation factor Ts [bacterium]|nr:translation elongation factor Ts [bacterium]
MEEIKLLREKTGAGMMECKKALDEASGDIEKAVEILRKKGIAKAAKRSENETSEGVIKLAVSADAKTGYMLQVNCETDFVARNEQFQKFVDEILALITASEPADLDALHALPMASGDTVKTSLDHMSGTIGEKMEIKNFSVTKSVGTVAAYLHAGGTIGVLVSLDTADKADLARDIAMQVAAANPRYINPEEVDQTELAKEQDVYREILVREGKPVEMIDKIMPGKVNKYYEEVCLIKQEYIKDDKQKVQDILGPVKVLKFVRFSL